MGALRRSKVLTLVLAGLLAAPALAEAQSVQSLRLARGGHHDDDRDWRDRDEDHDEHEEHEDEEEERRWREVEERERYHDATVGMLSSRVEMIEMLWEARRTDEAMRELDELAKFRDFGDNREAREVVLSAFMHAVEVLMDQKRFEKAEYFAKRGLEIAPEDSSEVAYLTMSMCHVLQSKGQTDAAIRCMRKATKLFEEIRRKTGKRMRR